MKGSVQISSHLDELDAPVWPFINGEAAKISPITGHIDTYRYQQANGGVVALWDDNHLHALAVTIRDDLNCTRCFRVTADQMPAATTESEDPSILGDEVFAGEFAVWWENEGQYVRAGGGDYEKSFAFEAWRHLYPRTRAKQPT